MAALIVTPFGFASTAHEVVEGIDLRGHRAIVTGASSGIGVETARALLEAGADVTLAVRDTAAGARVAGEIAGSQHGERVHVERLELADLDSVDAFAAAWDGPLHILVNNAGVMAIQDRQLSVDGHELQFATNHLGHFALAVRLHDALAADGNARIVSVSSGAHFRSRVRFDDIDFASRRYDPWAAYGQSKTANVLFSVAATAHWTSDGITSNALMPGVIVTNLGRHIGGVSTGHLKTTSQGAATSVLLATWPALDGIGGRYFVDCNEVGAVAARPDDGLGVASYAVDPQLAEQLWQVSTEMIDAHG